VIKRIVGYGVSMMALVGILFFGLQTAQKAQAYESVMEKIVLQSSAKSLAKAQLQHLVKQLSFGLYKSSLKQKYQRLLKQKEALKKELLYTTRLALLMLLPLMLSYILLPLREWIGVVSLASLVLLLLGISMPILMVTIHQEVRYLGDVIFSFESKGVLGSIEKLWLGGEYVIAGVMILFSFIIPLLKTLSFFAMSLFLKRAWLHKVVVAFKFLGKWSMLDVFVVALFLVYLSSNQGGVSRAEVEVGLYFFLAYVLLSLVLSLGIDRLLHRQRETASSIS
jgi:hypothetical protein